MDVARLNFSHGSAEEHAETAQRVRDAADRAGRRWRSCRTCPGPKLRIGKLGRRHRRAQARRPGDVRLRRATTPRATRGACTSRGPGWPTTVERGRDHLPRRRRRAAAGRRHARAGDGEIDAVVEIGGSVASRQGLNIPGETAALPSVPEEDFAPPRDRREDRRRPRRAVVRAPRRGHRGGPQAHAPAADRQDREAAGGAARRGDRARRRLRDGRARRPRHRAADRGGADRPEADHRARRRARPPGRSPRRRCSTRWSPPRARRAPRWPTSPTRSSTAPTR